MKKISFLLLVLAITSNTYGMQKQVKKWVPKKVQPEIPQIKPTTAPPPPPDIRAYKLPLDPNGPPFLKLRSPELVAQTKLLAHITNIKEKTYESKKQYQELVAAIDIMPSHISEHIKKRISPQFITDFQNYCSTIEDEELFLQEVSLSELKNKKEEYELRLQKLKQKKTFEITSCLPDLLKSLLILQQAQHQITKEISNNNTETIVDAIDNRSKYYFMMHRLQDNIDTYIAALEKARELVIHDISHNSEHFVKSSHTIIKHAIELKHVCSSLEKTLKQTTMVLTEQFVNAMEKKYLESRELLEKINNKTNATRMPLLIKDVAELHEINHEINDVSKHIHSVLKDDEDLTIRTNLLMRKFKDLYIAFARAFDQPAKPYHDPEQKKRLAAHIEQMRSERNKKNKQSTSKKINSSSEKIIPVQAFESEVMIQTDQELIPLIKGNIFSVVNQPPFRATYDDQDITVRKVCLLAGTETKPVSILTDENNGLLECPELIIGKNGEYWHIAWSNGKKSHLYIWRTPDNSYYFYDSEISLDLIYSLKSVHFITSEPHKSCIKKINKSDTFCLNFKENRGFSIVRSNGNPYALKIEEGNNQLLYAFTNNKEKHYLMFCEHGLPYVISPDHTRSEFILGDGVQKSLESYKKLFSSQIDDGSHQALTPNFILKNVDLILTMIYKNKLFKT